VSDPYLGTNWRCSLSWLGHEKASRALWVRPNALRWTERVVDWHTVVRGADLARVRRVQGRGVIKSLPGCPLTTALTSVASPILKVSGDDRDVCTARRLFTLCLALASIPTGSSCRSAGTVSHLHDMSTEGNAALCMATIHLGQYS
jgi:hypothetical protein